MNKLTKLPASPPFCESCLTNDFNSLSNGVSPVSQGRPRGSHGFDHNNPGSVFDNSDNIRDAFQSTVYGNPFDRFYNPDQMLFCFVSICFF